MSAKRWSCLLSGLLAVLSASVPVQAQSTDRIRAILENAVSAPKDQAALKERLQELEAELGGRTDIASGEYARGWILDHVGRDEAALAAYDRATVLDPKMGDGWYDAGVILKHLGRDKEALSRWKEALRVDPTNIDAAYNLGQGSYDMKDFAAALDWFQKARTLAPDDFGAAKKVLQAQNALGRWEDAEVTREEVYRLHRESKEDSVRALKSYCFDQFDVDRLHVFSYEIFASSGPDAVLFFFRGTRPDAKLWGQIDVVRPGAADAAPGAVQVIVKVADKKVGDPITLKSLPEYPALKERIRVLSRKHILPTVKDPASKDGPAPKP